LAGYLLDTDVVSKKDGANGGNIRTWLAAVDDSDLYLSAITIFELARGIAKKRGDDAAIADLLQGSLDTLRKGFIGRIFPIDEVTAEAWGRLAGPEHKQWMDRGLVATAEAHGLILVTCNSKHMIGLGVKVINPERSPPGLWAADGSKLKSR